MKTFSSPPPKATPTTAVSLDSSSSKGGGSSSWYASPLSNGGDNDDELIKLNVGGIAFTTTRATLCRVPGSHLEAMFSGRHANGAMLLGDGSHFVDRDGTHFRHVLNFLRTGGCVVSLPSSRDGKDELAIEADFYGLSELVRAIKMPQMDISECLTEEILSIRRDEDAARRAFAAGRAAEEPSCGGGSLIPLFCPDDGVQPLPVLYEGVDAKLEGDLWINLRDRPAAGERPAVTVDSLEAFRTNFNQQHPNVLNRLQDILLEEPVIIAGGSVLRALTTGNNNRTSEWWGKSSDIDIFLHCKDDREEANRIARRIFYALAADEEKWVVVRARGVVNMHSFVDENLDEKIQVVLRLYDSPAEVLLGFDVDCCCCAYDGRDVLLTKRCLAALRSGCNILNPLHSLPNKGTHELRLGKYASRGFPVLVPGLDQHRIDINRINQAKIKDLKGMGRFLKVAFDMDSALPRELYNWRTREATTRPKTPREIDTLRGHWKVCTSADELLVGGLEGYDEINGPVLVPEVFESRSGHHWWVGDFSPARETRDEAWEKIVDSTDSDEVPDGVPAKLIDAWSTDKRSREYLNAQMDPYDFNNLYYGHAYKDEIEGST